VKRSEMIELSRRKLDLAIKHHLKCLKIEGAARQAVAYSLRTKDRAAAEWAFELAKRRLQRVERRVAREAIFLRYVEQKDRDWVAGT